ncbi:MAG TPA: SDR family NAD(P)-dependent oxidoreductase [Polyangia bacterium]|nr:SDR family NAD(P)-dependent oxidoreductase [Polyangia bacterium]
MGDSFEGRVVVVTGAAGGLGPAVVAALKARGATCHTPSRQELDLTDEAAVTRYYGGLPGLWASVHVAGGFSMAPLPDTSLQAFEGQWRLNTVTAFLAGREAARRIARSEGKSTGGRIVNVGSRVVLEPPAQKIAYAAAKAAVAAMTRSMAAELRPAGILVNAVLPETIDTPANRAAMPRADRAGWTAPEAIAETIAWLASPANTTVTGALIPV